MNKIKVAVTGAAGQVGSILVNKMYKTFEFNVVALCRNPMSAAIIHSVTPGCEIRMGSITEWHSAKKLLNDCDIIINCALAMISGNPKMSLQMNKAIIDNISHLPSLKTFVHMSSISVYRACINNNRIPKSTFEHPRPDNDYGRSKLFIEQYVKKMCTAKKLRYYLLRLGHVIGAKMDRSKEILEFARDSAFCLPFNGIMPSNTVHVENLALQVIALIKTNSIHQGVYNIAEKHKNWRQVFDWHTKAVGLPAVAEMPRLQSERLNSHYRSRSITKDVFNWLQSLPWLSLIRYPAIFELAYHFLALTPPKLTQRLTTTYKRLDVKRQIKSMGQKGRYILSPIYFSDAMPGNYLNLPANSSANYLSDEHLSIDLKIWYQRFARPRWLPDSIKRISPKFD